MTRLLEQSAWKHSGLEVPGILQQIPHVSDLPLEQELNTKSKPNKPKHWEKESGPYTLWPRSSKTHRSNHTLGNELRNGLPQVPIIRETSHWMPLVEIPWLGDTYHDKSHDKQSLKPPISIFYLRTHQLFCICQDHWRISSSFTKICLVMISLLTNKDSYNIRIAIIDYDSMHSPNFTYQPLQSSVGAPTHRAKTDQATERPAERCLPPIPRHRPLQLQWSAPPGTQHWLGPVAGTDEVNELGLHHGGFTMVLVSKIPTSWGCFSCPWCSLQ